MTKYQGGINKQIAENNRAKARQLLSNLSAFNKLDKRIVDTVSEVFKLDADGICKQNGITYST